jgi:hypothetical protein
LILPLATGVTPFLALASKAFLFPFGTTVTLAAVARLIAVLLTLKIPCPVSSTVFV